MKSLSIIAVCFLTLLFFSSAMATGNNNNNNNHNNNNGNTHNNNNGNTHNNNHTNIHNHNNNNGNGNGGGGGNGGDQSQTQEQNQNQSQNQGQGQTQGQTLNNDINIGIGVGSNSSSTSVSGANANNEGVEQNTQVTANGGTGGTGIGGSSNSSSNSSASVGDVQAIVTFNEAKQYPVPGEINLPGVLNTPNNDQPGPSYYDPREMVFIKYVFTIEELEDMAGNRSPATTGDLQEKEVLPENQQSQTIAFYIESLPGGLKKENVRQVGMMSLDSNSKKVSTVTLFGVLGLEAAKRGANAVVISGEGYQRVDKALSFGPGASMTSPTGNSIATVALPFIFAQRWKVDNPWLHGTAIIVPTT